MSAIANFVRRLGDTHPRTRSHIASKWLAVAAVISLTVWQVAEMVLQRLPHPELQALLAAADTAARAQQEITREKEARGLMQPASVDPNRTGLIGPDWSEIVTTMGDLSAKRTATNPDLAAAIARALLTSRPAPGAAVALVLSGSFAGGNIAAIAAAEALGLRPVIVSSIGASMYGASDPVLTWVDMEALVVRAGIWTARSAAAVLGGESALGNSLSDTGREMLVAAARRNGLEPLAALDFPTLKADVQEILHAAAPDGFAAMISVGGTVLAMGTCVDSYRLPTGWIRGTYSCREGVPGLIHDYARDGVPVLQILNIKRLALDWGLPYDPVPLPVIGRNMKIYGRAAMP